jgi:hypothetical protein
MSGNIRQQPDLEKEKLWLIRLSTLLDTRWKIPYTNIRFGVDPLLSLIPVVGDVASAIITAVMIVMYVRLGVPNGLVMRMVGNMLIDMLFGCIPILGSIFDVGFRANRKNLDMAMKFLRA